MITSTANEKVRYVRSLHRKPVRHKENRFIVEGMRLIEEMKKAGQEPVFVFCTELFSGRPRAIALLQALRASGTQVLGVSDQVMRAMSDTKTPQGVLAVSRFPQMAPVHSALTLVLDGVRDPGNLGTILRSAEAAAVGQVITAKGTTDVFSPKVVRGGMGAHFRLPIWYDREWQEIEAALHDRQVLLADPQGDLAYYEVDWTKPSTLIVGGEAEGARREAREFADRGVAIPMQAGVESLNVAVATSIMLFEAARQRSAQAHDLCSSRAGSFV